MLGLVMDKVHGSRCKVEDTKSGKVIVVKRRQNAS